MPLSPVCSTVTSTGLLSALGSSTRIVPVRVDECSPRWVVIAPEQLSHLGTETARLGRTAVVGRRVFDRAGQFTAVIGPVSYPLFLSLLPGGETLRACLALTHFYLRDPLAVALHVALKREEVPPLRLGGGEAEPRLGWTTWLGRCDHDPEISLASVAG